MRLRDGLELLVARPEDPELLHAIGVGLAHRGISALSSEGYLGVSTRKEGRKELEYRFVMWTVWRHMARLSPGELF